MVSTLSESIGHVRSFSLSGPTGCWWTYFTHNSFVLVIYGITQFEFRRYRFVFIFLEKQIIGLVYLIMYCFRKWKCHFSDTIQTANWIFFFKKKKECDFILLKQNRSRKFRYFLNIIMVAGSIRVLFSGISHKSKLQFFHFISKKT